MFASVEGAGPRNLQGIYYTGDGETAAASMPASTLDAQMSVSEAGATDEAFGPRTCSIAGPVGLKQMGVVDSAPSSRTVLPMLSRPALELLRSALAATMKFAAAASTTSIFFFLVKPSSYSRTTYTDGRGDDGKTPRRRREGLRAQPRATRVQRTRAQAET